MWDALPAPLRRARGGRPTTTAHFLAPKRTCLRLPRSTAAVDVLAEFGIEPPSVLRMRTLLALRLRYAALSAGLGTPRGFSWAMVRCHRVPGQALRLLQSANTCAEQLGRNRCHALV